MAEAVGHFIEEIGRANMFPGDTYVTNDPWKGTGHLHDITMVSPSFKGDVLVGFFACTAHVVDVGGRGFGADANSVYEEGLYIPILKLFDKGAVDQTLIRIIRGNVREPDQVVGDFYSLAACNDVGHKRLLGSYFDMYPPGHGRRPGGGDLGPEAGAVWRHGDWLRIHPDGSCVIYGRSDATINRHGLRMGTSELYSAVEALPEVLDSMVVDLEYLGRESDMPLFVVLREGVALDDALKARINDRIKTALSPRFIPNGIFQVPEIPRTLSGKKQELPIKKLLLGQPLEKVINREAMANPGCLDWYVDFARQRATA